MSAKLRRADFKPFVLNTESVKDLEQEWGTCGPNAGRNKIFVT